MLRFLGENIVFSFVIFLLPITLFLDTFKLEVQSSCPLNEPGWATTSSPAGLCCGGCRSHAGLMEAISVYLALAAELRRCLKDAGLVLCRVHQIACGAGWDSGIAFEALHVLF